MTTQGLSRGPDKEAVREWAEMGLVIPQPTACRGVRRKSPDLDLPVRQDRAITLRDMSEVSSRSRCTASDPGLAVDLRREGLGAIAALMVPARPEVA